MGDFIIRTAVVNATCVVHRVCQQLRTYKPRCDQTAAAKRSLNALILLSFDMITVRFLRAGVKR